MWLSGTPAHPAAKPVQLWAGLCSEHEGLIGSWAECCGTAGLCVSVPLSLLGPVWPVPFCCLPRAPSLPFSCHEVGAWPLVLLEACSEEASSVQPQHPTSAHFKSTVPAAPSSCLLLPLRGGLSVHRGHAVGPLPPALLAALREGSCRSNAGAASFPLAVGTAAPPCLVLGTPALSLS